MSKTTSQEAQSLDAKLNPDFSHRLTSYYDEESLSWSVMNSIDTMALRATSILRLLSGEFAKEDEDDSRLDDTIIYFSIDAVIQEIEDMKALVSAHYRQSRKEDEAQAKTAGHKKTD